MKNKFIERVTAQIQDKTARMQIEQELESHILDKIDYYVEIGYSYEEAEKRATEEMGSPEDTALPLNGLHQGGLRQEILSFAWIILLNIALFISFILLGVKFNYQSYFYQIFHSIGIDFLSLAFAVVFVLTLIKAQKRHSKLLAGLVSGEILLLYFLGLTQGGISSVFGLFAPLFYALVTIISQGFSGYIDCIFGYGYIPDNLKPVLSALSAAMIIIFIAWSLLLFVSIYRKERMRSSQKIIKPINIAKLVICPLLALNFVVMAYATVMAVLGLPEKIEDTKLERSMMMETVINWDTSKSYEELLSYLYGLGYKNYHSEDNPTYINQKEMYLYNNNGVIMISKFDESEDYQLTYVVTTQSYTQPLIVRDDVAIGFKETSWMEVGKINLQKFLGFDWSDKTIMVTHYMYGNQDTIQFTFVGEETNEAISFDFDYYSDEFAENDYRSWEDYNFSATGYSTSNSGEFYPTYYDKGDDTELEKTHSSNLMEFMDEIMENNK
ncbi:MAG: hypothetical protein J1E85_07910 [Ruminococcus sp.]|nr:hypothetical protein [Ruminococcus sp.]